MKNLIYIFFLMAVTFVSCNKTSAPDCFKKTGKHISKERVLTPFKFVVLEANLEVVLKVGAEHKVTLIGGENMLDKITTTVSSNSLIIDNKNTCNFVRGYKHKLLVEVTAPRYDYIVTNSIGTFEVDGNINQDTLVVRSEAGDIFVNGTYNELRTSSHGNGNVYFNGTANRLLSYMNGTNYLFAENANISNYIFIESISIANAYVTAPTNGVLEYHLWKSGNVYYKGSPVAIAGKVEGTGGVYQKK